MSLRKLRIGRFVFRVTRLNTLLLAISLSPRRSPVSPVDFISCTKRYIYTKWNTVDTAYQSNRSAILTVQHPEHISCPILLPLSCIVPHYIVALGTRFLVLQCCYCPSNLAAITIISAHDLTISVKVKTVVRTRGLALVASGQNSFAIQRARRTQCDERHDPGTWQAGERNSTLSVTVQAFGTYLPHGWLFDDSP